MTGHAVAEREAPKAAAPATPAGAPAHATTALAAAVGNRAFAAMVQRRGRDDERTRAVAGAAPSPFMVGALIEAPPGPGQTGDIADAPERLDEDMPAPLPEEDGEAPAETPHVPHESAADHAQSRETDGPEKECACGGECDDCAAATTSLSRTVDPRPIARTPSGSALIQRGLVDDAIGAVSSAASSVASAAQGAAEAVLPAGLLQGIRGLVGSGEDQVADVGRLPEQATDAETEVRETGRQSREEGEEAAREGRDEGERHDAEARQGMEQGRQRAQEVQGQATGAVTQMDGISGLVGPALDPGAMISNAPGVQLVAERAAAVGRALPGAGEVAADVEGDIQQGLAAGPTAGWDCTSSEVMAMVSNVGQTLGGYAERGGRALLGDQGYERMMQFADGVASGIRDLASRVRRRVSSLVDTVTGWWNRTVQPVVETVQRTWSTVTAAWERVKGRIRERLSALGTRAAALWESVKTRVGGFIERKVEQVRTFVSGVADRARSMVGSLWDAVPGPVKSAITGLGAVALGPIGLAVAAGQRLGRFVASHKDEILGALKSAGNSVVEWIGEKYRAGREVVTSVVSTVRDWGREIGQAARSKAQAIYGAVDEATGGWLTKVRQAAQRVGTQLKENACALLGTTAGPCIRNALPRSGDFVEASISGDVTIPVEGVPVKVAAGAKVNVQREGSNESPQYSATLSGEGSLGVEVAASGGGGGGAGGAGGGTSVGVKVDLPAGGRADVSSLWSRLTGGGGSGGGATPAPAAGGATATPAPSAGASSGTAAPAAGSTSGTSAPAGGATTGTAAPAPGATSGTPAPGQPAAAQPATAGGAEVKVGAGFKGAAEAKYQFSGAAGDEASCAGLGGLTAMLAAYGASGAVAQLPPPFGMVGAAAGGAASGAFADRLVSLKMTLSQFGGVTVDIKREGIGALNIAGTAERGVTLGAARQLQDDPATRGVDEREWVQSATLFQSLSGSAGGSLSVGPLSGIGGSLGGGGRMALTLQYRPAQDKIEAVNAEVSANASVALNNVNTLVGALPPEIANPVRAAVQPYLQGNGQATVDASIKYTAKLLPLVTALDAVLSNPETCTVDAVWGAVSTFFATADNFTREIEVSLTARTRLAGIGVEASQQGQAGQVGVNVSVSLDAGHTCKLYPTNECLSRLQPAAPAAAAR